MDQAHALTLPDAAGAWWRAAMAVAWVCGIALQLQQPWLWVSRAYPLVGAAALGALLVAGRLRWRRAARVGVWIALAAAGFAYAGWRADVRLADALAPAWEGCDVEVVGVIDDMPQ